MPHWRGKLKPPGRDPRIGYRVGDTVECVEINDTGTLVVGRRYTVTEISFERTRVAELTGVFFHRRFRRVRT